jgi:putative membrane protein
MWGNGMNWVWGALMMTLVWGSLLGLLIFALRGGGVRWGERREQGRRAHEILAERFARGEIDESEYEERKRVLERDTTSTT